MITFLFFQYHVFWSFLTLRLVWNLCLTWSPDSNLSNIARSEALIFTRVSDMPPSQQQKEINVSGYKRNSTWFFSNIFNGVQILLLCRHVDATAMDQSETCFVDQHRPRSGQAEHLFIHDSLNLSVRKGTFDPSSSFQQYIAENIYFAKNTISARIKMFHIKKKKIKILERRTFWALDIRIFVAFWTWGHGVAGEGHRNLHQLAACWQKVSFISREQTTTTLNDSLFTSGG